MNTMPKDTTLTELQKRLISERAQRVQDMITKAAQQTENIMGRVDQRSDPFAKMRASRVTAKTVASNMKDMSAQLGRVIKQEGIDTARQEAKRDATNDAQLATLASRALTLGKARSRRRKGGRKKRSTRRKV